MVQIEPNQPCRPGPAPKELPPHPMPSTGPSSPTDGAEDVLHYAPDFIDRIATHVTPGDLERLVSEAMERAEGASEDLLEDSACHPEVPSSGFADAALPRLTRKLTAKQFNSHKRSKLNRKRKQREARGVGGLGESEGSRDGGGAVENEEQPPGGTGRKGRGRRKGKNKAVDRGGEATAEGESGGMGEQGVEGDCVGMKRRGGKEGLRSPPPKRSKTARRRYRRQIRAQSSKLPGSGYWASEYVRAKVAKAASVKSFALDMGAKLEEDAQYGAYRPRPEGLDECMEQLKNATKKAIETGTDESAKAFLNQLVHEKDYRLFEWDGINPALLVDTEDRVFAALVGRPNHPSWLQRCERLFDLMLQDAPRFAALPKKKTVHHRGAYPCVHTGITFAPAPGDQVARNLSLEAEEESLVNNPEQLELQGGIQQFVETSFSLFAPRLYGYYTSHMEKLRMHPVYRHLNYRDPYGSFFSMTVNSGPKVVTLPHRDVMNLAFGWCAVVALGRFQPKLGGHLIIHDLRLVFTFPPGSVVLFPSAFLWHSNVPIGKDDQRASLTFYSAGALFRFIDNSFMTETGLKENDFEEHQRRAAEKERSKAVAAGLYSKASEIIHPPSPSSPPLAFSSPLSSVPSSPMSLPLSSPPGSPY